MGKTTHKIEIEGIRPSEIPTDVLAQIIQRITQSIQAMVRHEFGKEGKDFYVFLGPFSRQSTALAIGGSDPRMLKNALNSMSQSFATQMPANLPKHSYNAMKSLVRLSKKQGRGLIVYANDAREPLFQFNQQSPFPEYPSPIEIETLIEEEVTEIGEIYRVSGEKQPLIRIRLVTGQIVQKKFDMEYVKHLRNYMFQGIAVTGIAKRKPGSKKFKQFEITKITPSHNSSKSIYTKSK